MSQSSQPANPTGKGSPVRDVRMRGFQDRTDVPDVLELLKNSLRPLPSVEVDLHEAAGRVLASDLIAPFAVPPFDRAAMDGYALRGQESFGAGPYNPLEFEVIGMSLPARPFADEIQAGQAVRIMTGAPMPIGTDAVIPVEAAEEYSDETAKMVRITEAVPPGRHVGKRGEDIEPNTIVVHSGRLLRPQDVGVLASLGINPVPVIGKPTVAVLITGDELLPCGSRPERYRIVDTNSVMLEGLVQRDGGVCRIFAIIPDRREAVREALQVATSDVVLISGGSSVGQEDHVPKVLAELGQLKVHGVALRPASPTGVGFLAGRPVFLLPGNPVSCLCAYDLFAGPAIRRLGGKSMQMPYRSACLRLARKIASAVGRVDYVRAIIRDRQVEPLATTGASILSSTTRADGFVLVPHDSEGFAAGETVCIYLYD